MIRTLWRLTLFRQYRRYSKYRSLALAKLLAPIFEHLKPRIIIDVGGYQSSWLKFVGNPEDVITVDIDPKALKKLACGPQGVSRCSTSTIQKIEGLSAFGNLYPRASSQIQQMPEGYD